MLDLFFPDRCMNCNRIIAKNILVCELCMDEIFFTHHRFLEQNTLKERAQLLFPVEHAFGLMEFKKDSLSRKIIHQLKYRNRENIGKILARWTMERLHLEDHKPDILITVPLHPKKLKKRGYNQLHQFAETLSEHYKIPVDHDIIKKNHYSKSQALRDKKHRLETDKLFSITKNITGKHVLLIDDVYTTGNTLASVAWEIIKAGDNKVSVLVMAVDE